jgi:hypothetical protein
MTNPGGRTIGHGFAVAHFRMCGSISTAPKWAVRAGTSMLAPGICRDSQMV